MTPEPFNNSVIIAGIHTGIGKTICSAILCQAFGYDYWKPVQAGDLDNTDSNFIQQHVTNPTCTIHPEKYRLSTAASPHYAAMLDGIAIQKETFELPTTNNKLVVETAGGLMSPLGTDFLNIDLVEQLNLPVILVCSNYLGSINHSLLSWQALASRKINTIGIVFSGEQVTASEEYILAYTRLPMLFAIPPFSTIDPATISTFSNNLALNFNA